MRREYGEGCTPFVFADDLAVLVTARDKDELLHRGYIDTNGQWGENIRVIAQKAAHRVAALSRLMPNIGSPKPDRRRVLHSVMHSIVLYAGPVWYMAMETSSYRDHLVRVERDQPTTRSMCLYDCVCGGPVGDHGMCSLHLMVLERKRLHRSPPDGTEGRAHTLLLWQRKWDATVAVAQ
ncbi:uncharacterized protein [Diabrotica undecimpunctata]|uniref:uncharacterized protein n=1 Tax=Diabrotica undecimpunctata TaxID=50387 RepID=UPI003B639B16